MDLGKIKIIPLAAESLGVRSMATYVETPDVRILLDPSASLSRRFWLLPHPLEYERLKQSLDRIMEYVDRADILFISHYHYDHFVPGFTNYTFNFSSEQLAKNIVRDKIVYAKDNKNNINYSQRKRGYHFEKITRKEAKELHWADNSEIQINSTKIIFSRPVPHGKANTPLGFVIMVLIEHDHKKFAFCPDIQGPIENSTTDIILNWNPDIAYIGGPPVYLTNKITKEELQSALENMKRLVQKIPTVVFDHHLLRIDDWRNWAKEVFGIAKNSNHTVLCASEASGREYSPLEFKRKELYHDFPPSKEFIAWTKLEKETRSLTPPPI